MSNEKPALIVKNKNASRNYKLNESFEAGIVLEGWEVKSLRQNKVDVKNSYVNIKKNEASAVWDFTLTSDIKSYVIEKGSISLDGISLTIAKKFEDHFSVALIPHTLDITTWKEKKIGDLINVEADMMAKYLENFIGNKNEI